MKEYEKLELVRQSHVDYINELYNERDNEKLFSKIWILKNNARVLSLSSYYDRY